MTNSAASTAAANPCSYHIKCKLIDNAVSLSKNVGFTHWRSRIVNKSNDNAFEIEAVEVDLFGQDGKLKDIWMFR